MTRCSWTNLEHSIHSSSWLSSCLRVKYRRMLLTSHSIGKAHVVETRWRSAACDVVRSLVAQQGCEEATRPHQQAMTSPFRQDVLGGRFWCVHRIAQDERGEKGDALMPLLFSLGQHEGSQILEPRRTPLRFSGCCVPLHEA